MASAQLQLINTDRQWKLDRRTVEIGRAGVAKARAALAAATAPDEAPDPFGPFEPTPEHPSEHRAAA